MEIRLARGSAGKGLTLHGKVLFKVFFSIGLLPLAGSPLEQWYNSLYWACVCRMPGVNAIVLGHGKYAS